MLLCSSLYGVVTVFFLLFCTVYLGLKFINSHLFEKVVMFVSLIYLEENCLSVWHIEELESTVMRGEDKLQTQ